MRKSRFRQMKETTQDHTALRNGDWPGVREAEIRIVVQSQLREKNLRDLILKKTITKKGWWIG
jgi:hypothetical protein